MIAKATPGQILGAATLNNTGSAGLIKGASDQVTQATLGVKYNKAGTNPQGKVESQFQSYNKPDGTLDTQLHYYWAKSNAIATLSVKGGTASFSAKANVVELIKNEDGTTIGATNIDSGAIFQIAMTDGTPDKLAITLQRKSGGLWFSSNWDGTKTLEKPILSGSLTAQ